MKTKEKTENKPSKKEEKKIAGAVGVCSDKDCPIHGHLKSHGRVFEGKIIRKFYKRIVIEFERTIYIKKYERYKKSKTKVHARLPTCMNNEVKVGDYVKIQECRPLSKIIHFVFIKKIREADAKQEAAK